MTVDGLTKTLIKKKHKTFIGQLHLKDLSSRL